MVCTVTNGSKAIDTRCGVTTNGTVSSNATLTPHKFVVVKGSELGWMFFHIIIVFLAIKLIPKIPKLGKYIPASLTGLLIATFFEWVMIRPLGYRTPIIGEVGKVSGGFPTPFFVCPQYVGKIAPFSWETLQICFLPAFIAAVAGAVEAVMTMEVVNDLTEMVNECPNQQLIALSIDNVISAIYGMHCDERF